MRTAVLVMITAIALGACEKRDPVADQANNVATAPAEVDVLPPDESVATPTNELENGDDEDVNVSEGYGDSDQIPAAFHGRWALTPADCTSPNSDTKGLLVVSADRLRFYEALATPRGELKFSPKSVSGDFAFRGEGMNWKKYEALELQNNKLVRTESGPMRSYTYARCTS
jgi:hypothetical protein